MFKKFKSFKTFKSVSDIRREGLDNLAGSGLEIGIQCAKSAEIFNWRKLNDAGCG
jgi:hypothetical protein